MTEQLEYKSYDGTTYIVREAGSPWPRGALVLKDRQLKLIVGAMQEDSTSRRNFFRVLEIVVGNVPLVSGTYDGPPPRLGTVNFVPYIDALKAFEAKRADPTGEKIKAMEAELSAARARIAEVEGKLAEMRKT